MAISKEKKSEVLSKLEAALKSAKSLVFVNFRGLTVAHTTAMRQGLKKEGVSYTVAKKTLARRALDGGKFTGEAPKLEGELALAWGEDLIAPSREVYAFQKKFPENLKILGGVFDGRYMNQSEIMEMAQIPTLQVLRGKFVNIINSPIQRMAIALSEVAKLKA